ncbi:DUF4911 domain-containing protein [Maridesulfovibrio bastinii]|uniref:DUF4911 domain-containing protein n=1 Tax=Maridesulfovibrio bastinii TaxID=47157 RepID=UPI000410F733|nr:DUF4911 domain-containing protein [Maridesulfovibrio bastinii]
MPRKRRKPRPKPLLPAPKNSDRLYIQVKPSDIAMFRFMLEAVDNIAIFTVADKIRGILLLRYSRHQQRELLEFLDSLKDCVNLTILPFKVSS